MSKKFTELSVFSKEASEVQKRKFSLKPVAQRFFGDRRGTTGMMFALAIVPVIGIAGAGLDYNKVLNIKSQMQGALDAATLAGGRQLQVSGDADSAWQASQDYFSASVSSIPDSNFTDEDTRPALSVSQADAIDLDTNSVNLTAAAVFKPAFLPLLGISEIPVAVQTAGVLKQGTPGNNGYLNLELSLMLDVTGSMGGNKIQALKASAKDLVQIVLDNGNQDEYTSKVTIAPFAASVDASSFINVVTGYTAISSLIPGLENLPAAPAGPEFAAATPRFSTAMTVKTGHRGFSGFGGGFGSGFGSGGNNGGGGGCPAWNPHCPNNNNGGGNNGGGNNGGGNNGGGNNGGGNGVSAPVTTCISERTGVNAYTDVAPDYSTANTLFPNVTSSSNCPGAGIVPLTNDQDALDDAIDNLPASGSTAGHLGTAWAWYMVSPKWASIFPAESEPAEYQGDTKKVVVLMTDGDFNKKYAGPNSYTQTEQLCDNMKAEGIEIFTVGFQLPNQNARDIMDYCASSPVDVHRFFAESTNELQTSYRQIGFGLKDLKITN